MTIKSITITLGFLLASMTMTTSAQDGLITIESQYTVNETADRFERLVNEKGLKFFMRIDHMKNAENADLTLRPTQVILFGNPVAGTALMNCGQTVAIDLPQKALFWQDADGKSWLSYNDPSYLQERHQLDSKCASVLEKVTGLLAGLSKAAASADSD